ncbi:GGDEF domain-containing protein, partial [Eubacterium sp.]
TGVMNRNEMNNLIDKIYNLTDDNPNSVGVIFVDLNGLKTVNDECGHVAGDILLKNAAAALEEVFLPSDIYRAGGDEFTIIVTGISESELLKKVEAVREAAEHYENVSFAIGYCYDENKHNVKEALRIADERMYEDKKKYYEMHPEKKKR